MSVETAYVCSCGIYAYPGPQSDWSVQGFLAQHTGAGHKVEDTRAQTYVVTYGCGQGAVLRPDGSWEPYEDHVDGCEHQEG